MADIAAAFDAADKAAPLGAYGCFLLEREGDSLRVIAATAEMRVAAAKWVKLPLSADDPLAAAARDRSAIWLAGSDECLSEFPSLSTSISQDVQGRAVIPLVVGGECVGVLGVAFLERRTFDSDEREYLAAVANLWAQALHRARLAEAERDAMRRVLEAEASATRKKDEFMAMLGHELRNPLAPIVTATSLMRVRGRATSGELGNRRPAGAAYRAAGGRLAGYLADHVREAVSQAGARAARRRSRASHREYVAGLPVKRMSSFT